MALISVEMTMFQADDLFSCLNLNRPARHDFLVGASETHNETIHGCDGTPVLGNEHSKHEKKEDRSEAVNQEHILFNSYKERNLLEKLKAGVVKMW